MNITLRLVCTFTTQFLLHIKLSVISFFIYCITLNDVYITVFNIILSAHKTKTVNKTIKKSFVLTTQLYIERNICACSMYTNAPISYFSYFPNCSITWLKHTLASSQIALFIKFTFQ